MTQSERLPEPVWRTEACIAAPCVDVDLPGYLILRPTRRAATFQDAPVFLAELGATLGLLEAAILQAVSAPRLYVLRFSEAEDSLHFHLFPRTTTLTAAYTEAFPRREGIVIGPELFEWARNAYRLRPGSGLSPGTLSVAASIRERLRVAGSAGADCAR